MKLSNSFLLMEKKCIINESEVEYKNLFSEQSNSDSFILVNKIFISSFRYSWAICIGAPGVCGRISTPVGPSKGSENLLSNCHDYMLTICNFDYDDFPADVS